MARRTTNSKSSLWHFLTPLASFRPAAVVGVIRRRLVRRRYRSARYWVRVLSLRISRRRLMAYWAARSRCFQGKLALPAMAVLLGAVAFGDPDLGPGALEEVGDGDA